MLHPIFCNCYTMLVRITELVRHRDIELKKIFQSIIYIKGNFVDSAIQAIDVMWRVGARLDAESSAQRLKYFRRWPHICNLIYIHLNRKYIHILVPWLIAHFVVPTAFANKWTVKIFILVWIVNAQCGHSELINVQPLCLPRCFCCRLTTNFLSLHLCMPWHKT